MNKDGKKLLLTLCVSLTTVVSFSVVLQEAIRYDRTKSNGKNDIVDGQWVSAVISESFPEENGGAAPLLPEEKRLKETTDEWDYIPAASVAANPKEQWLTIPKELSIRLQSEQSETKPRAEDMDMDTAARIGLGYLDAWMDADCSGSTVRMMLTTCMTKSNASIRVWHGSVQKKDSVCSFIIDSVNGTPYFLSNHLSTPKNQPVMLSEYESALNEPWMSTSCFMETIRPETWSVMIDRFMEDHFPNGDKLSYYTELNDFDDRGYVCMDCILNDGNPEAERKTLAFFFDIRTRKICLFSCWP